MNTRCSGHLNCTCMVHSLALSATRSAIALFCLNNALALVKLTPTLTMSITSAMPSTLLSRVSALSYSPIQVQRRVLLGRWCESDLSSPKPWHMHFCRESLRFCRADLYL